MFMAEANMMHWSCTCGEPIGLYTETDYDIGAVRIETWHRGKKVADCKVDHHDVINIADTILRNTSFSIALLAQTKDYNEWKNCTW